MPRRGTTVISSAILLVCGLFASAAFGQEHLNGPLSGLLTNQQYWVTGDISVESGDSLIIEAGAQLLFSGNYNFSIWGHISVNGTEQDSVFFMPLSELIEWDGIKIYDSADDNGAFYYARISGSGNTGVHYHQANPVLDHCLVEGNSSPAGGGGIICDESSPYLIRIFVENNLSQGPGGGLWLDNGSSPEFISCFVRDNTATGGDGGGIFCDNGSSPHLYDCVVSENSCGEDNSGGGIHLQNGSSPFMELTQIIENTGGGLGGGGIYCENSSPLIEVCWISSNIVPYSYMSEAVGGAAKFHAVCGAEIRNTIFTENYCALDGGAVYLNINGEISFRDCLFSDNNASVNGGVIAIADLGPDTAEIKFEKNSFLYNNALYGSVFYTGSQDSIILINNTFSQNSQYLDSPVIFMDFSTVWMINCIFADNYNIGIHFEHVQPPLSVFYSDFHNSTLSNFSGNIPAGLETLVQTNTNGDSCDIYHNIFLDPVFADPVFGDFHLQWGSPCIDAGDPTSPLDPDSTIADIGAYYFDQLTSVENPSFQFLIHNFELGDAYPNPFNHSTTITYTINEKSGIKIALYNTLGQEISTLYDGIRPPGVYHAHIDGDNMTSGLYFLRLQSNNYIQTQKLLLIK